MKAPKLKTMKINKSKTSEVRNLIKSAKRIKITINIDKDNLDELKILAEKTGASYQKLLNQILRNGLEGKLDTESRLDKLEKELNKIKKRLAA